MSRRCPRRARRRCRWCRQRSRRRSSRARPPKQPNPRDVNVSWFVPVPASAADNHSACVSAWRSWRLELEGARAHRATQRLGGVVDDREAITHEDLPPADHFLSSGLWFHSHSGPSVAATKVSTAAHGARPAGRASAVAAGRDAAAGAASNSRHDSAGASVGQPSRASGRGVLSSTGARERRPSHCKPRGPKKRSLHGRPPRSIRGAWFERPRPSAIPRAVAARSRIRHAILRALAGPKRRHTSKSGDKAPLPLNSTRMVASPSAAPAR